MNTKLVFLALLLGPITAQAGVTTYTSEASFLAQIGGHATDSFDDLLADDVMLPPVDTSTGRWFPRSAGPVNYDLNVGTWYTLWNNRDSANPSDIRLSPENASRALNFVKFSAPVFALGANFFITDIWGEAQTGKSIKLTLTDMDNVVTNLTVSNTTADTYRGFVSTVAIKSFSVIADKPLENNWATVNNFSVNAVPEPSSWALFGLGLLGLAAQRRRQQRQRDAG